MDKALFYFDKETTFPCRCGLTHHIPTRRTLLGDGVMEEIPTVLRDLGMGKRILLLWDENTYQSGGKTLEGMLSRTGFHTIPGMIHRQKRFRHLEPDEEARSQAGRLLQEKPDCILAVGSGVLNDLAKFIAHRAGLPYSVLATAPSMDGYSSPGAPMLVGGYKITFDATPPIAIFMDLEILAHAPLRLIQSGFADLVGKTTANADWTLRHLLFDEHECAYTWELVRDALIILEKNAERVRKRDEEAIFALSVALLNSGFSMTITGDSRPASGAEHLIAHYLEIMSLHRDWDPSLHGLRVGAATALVSTLYDYFLSLLPSFKWERLHNLGPTENTLEEVALHFGPLYPYIEKATRKKIAQPLIPDKRTENETFLTTLETAIRAKLSPLPDPSLTLTRCGAPTTFGEMGFSLQTVRDALRYSRYVRARFTILDLLDQAGLLNDAIEYAMERNRTKNTV